MFNPETVNEIDKHMSGTPPDNFTRMWRALAASWRYELEKYPEDIDPTEAAMIGILLALVKKLWPGCTITLIQCPPSYDPLHEACVSIYKDDPTPGRRFSGLDESASEAAATALLGALIASLSKEVSPCQE